MKVEIPGYKIFQLHHLLLDFNGTIAVDGVVKEEVRQLIRQLAEQYSIHVLTSDTRGTSADQTTGLPLTLQTFAGDEAALAKAAIARELGGEHCACIGNGRNDLLMFQTCALSIAVLEEEGLYPSLLNSADLMVRSSEDALKLLLDPKRLIAGLRG